MDQRPDAAELPSLISQNLELFCCPACDGELALARTKHSLNCQDCGQEFLSDNGLPLLFWPNEWDGRSDVTESVKAFYEENPFPNYEDIDSDWSLRDAAKRGIFGRLLDEQTPRNAKVLEVGCGTGQLSNFMGMSWGRSVFGADLCINSLSLGHRFKSSHGIDGTAFLQMNLFRPAFRPESFDLVVCNGVLHHTSDPELGFRSISKLVKKGGLIVIGLYNWYGRLTTDLRRIVFRASGDRFKFLDPRLRDRKIGEVRRNTWFMDQYKHPHESKHTYGQIMKWFQRSGFEFVNSIPKATAFDSITEQEKLFEDNSSGTWLDHFIVQTGILITGGAEGGFFLMIGRRVS